MPYADYFDHGSDYVEVEPAYDSEGNYHARAAYDVAAGSPLRISYADPRNPSHLLARYGFLDEDCPATYCKLLPMDVNGEMLELGYSYDRMLFYKSGEVADEVSKREETGIDILSGSRKSTNALPFISDTAAPLSQTITRHLLAKGLGYLPVPSPQRDEPTGQAGPNGRTQVRRLRFKARAS